MYNFVIFQNPNDYYRIAFAESQNMTNVNVLFGVNLHGSLIKALYKVHFSDRLNSCINIPFKSLWNSCYYNDYVDTDKKVCFIYTGAYLQAVSNGLLEYLKSKYPDSKHVLFMQDIVASYPLFNESLLRKFDLCISYDFGDVEKYGFLYHPTIYTRIMVPDNPNCSECDLFFVGAAKDRLEEIYYYYDLFTSKGKDCKFLISNVKKEYQRKSKGIKYIDKISYLENLQYVIKAKAVLDIVQKGSQGFTLRTWEAVYYNKILYSNNPSVLKIQGASKGAYFLDEEFNVGQSFEQGTDYSKSLIEQTSLNDLLSFIENHLN